uniref:Tudor-knot domain-containing protein n=1 Tax=Panagrolaimus davidi TaxID=227884 RepID=A0A914QHE8_9BILA
MASQVPPYTQSSLVLCKHTDNLYYEAKIIKAYQNKQGEWVYKLHYSGWNSRYDENIKHSDTPSRFMAHTPDNIEMTKVLLIL